MQSWIDLPGLPRFQPSEIMKFVVPVLLAWYLASRLTPKFKHLFWSAVMIFIPAGLIVLQNDTGTAIMVFMSGVFVVLLAEFAGVSYSQGCSCQSVACLVSVLASASEKPF